MPEPERGELGVVQRFAEHAAVALAQAQRAQAQHDVAALYRRFQASLSPAVKVDTPFIKVATFYRPGEGRMLLGGDFIDAVTRPNGSVAAVIGDVTGHGPDAAALGASLRAAWRALALRGASLQANMKTLNSLTLDESDRAEQGELGLGLLATVCAVEIDAAGRRARFVNAGHPMPLLMGSEVVPLVHTPGMMLGVEQYGDWAPHEVTLPREWGLLLYSDGIVEARMAPGSGARLGLKGFLPAVADLWRRRATAAADLQTLVDGVQAGRDGVLEDDVTLLLLAARRRGPQPEPRDLADRQSATTSPGRPDSSSSGSERCSMNSSTAYARRMSNSSSMASWMARPSTTAVMSSATPSSASCSDVDGWSSPRSQSHLMRR